MKRTLSKKSISYHKDPTIKEELKNIENMQLTSENILEKLLNSSNSQKKLILDHKKYNPKFEKKDYQTLLQENQSLKLQLKAQKQNITNLKFRLSDYERKVKFLQGIQQKWQCAINEEQHAKKQPVYTQILKKKIQQLNELYLNSEEKIKELKQLPHISVFQQSNIEKQYLMKETVRLKAIITASTSQGEEVNYENKFLKLMKEENQKLKSTIRLLQNDKNLLKSRQILQKRQINDFKKEIEQLKATIIVKQAQIQTQTNQYKNMIFKKAQQFNNEQKKKENVQYQALKKSYQGLQENLKQLQIQKESLLNQNQKYKKNQKINETKKNNQDKQKNDLRIDNNKLRKVIQDLRQQLQRQKENVKQIQNENKKKRKQKKLPTSTKIQQYPAVKFQDIELPLMVLIHHVQSGNILNLSDLFDQDEIRCSKLIDIFSQEPLCLQKSDAMKLARYIVEGNTSKRVVYNQKAITTKTLCVTTLKAAMNKLSECRNSVNDDRWRCILAKSKKLMPQLQRMNGEIISKQAFLNMLSRHINQSFEDYVTYAVLQSFDLIASESEIMISVGRLVDLLECILTNKVTH